jgi:dimethylamine/trimethylamine dehydrogenase
VLTRIGEGEAEIACVFTGRTRVLPCASVVMVAGRASDDRLYHALVDDAGANEAAGIRRVVRIGDAEAPATIAAAVWSGHRFARELGERLPDGPTYRTEPAGLAADF